MLFPLGSVYITAHAKDTLREVDVLLALIRHGRGDWGDVGSEDRAENELSLKEGFRLLSVYKDANSEAFWIITAADRSCTTVLLPEDY